MATERESMVLEDVLELSRSISVQDRMNAAELLPSFRSEEALERLIEMLDDHGEIPTHWDQGGSVSNTAAWALANLRDDRAVNPLIKRILSFTSTYTEHPHMDQVRGEPMAQALARLGPKGVAELIDLHYSENPLHRLWANKGLAETKDDEHVALIIESALNDPNPLVRKRAITHFSCFSIELVAPKLIHLISCNDEHSEDAARCFRYNAGSYLVELKELLKSEISTIRKNAVIALMNQENVREVLLNILRNDPEAQIRKEIAIEIKNTDETRNVMVEVLEDDDPSITWTLTQRLCGAEELSSNVLDRLVEYLDNPNKLIRKCAAYIILNKGSIKEKVILRDFNAAHPEHEIVEEGPSLKFQIGEYVRWGAWPEKMELSRHKEILGEYWEAYWSIDLKKLREISR